MSQLSLFEVQEVDNILDIRTEKQESKKIAYDVGEYIAGSRKEMAALRKAFENNHNLDTLADLENYSPGLAEEIINKEELTKSFNLENEFNNGTEPAVARFKQLLIQRISTKPSDSKEERLAYLTAIQYLLSELEKLKVWDDLTEFLRITNNYVYYESRHLGFFVKKVEEMRQERDSFSPHTQEYASHNRKLSNYQETLDTIQKAKELKLRSLGERFVNFFKSESSYRSTLKNALKVDSWETLLEPKKATKGTTRKKVWERTLPERPDRIGGGQSPVDKPEDLISMFGFRGIQFGNYVQDEKGMEHLLRSSEAMMDLADILGVDYQAISLNGTLSIAYGARGRGGQALATYEPISHIINMTKEKGCLGVFAHEWFHSLDCYLFNQSHSRSFGRRGYASEPKTLGEHYPVTIRIAFEELVAVMTKGSSISYFENTNKDGVSWRGNTFKSLYAKHNGNLLEVMKEKIGEEKDRLEARSRYYRSLSLSEKELEKQEKRFQRDIKKFAQALAWYHEQQTGKRIAKIPYPSDKTNYFQASISLDKGKIGKYWSDPIEMAARSFESYIQDQLKANGRVSDYLVAGSRDGLAFPIGEERVAINKKIEEIIQLIKLEGILEGNYHVEKTY